MPKQQPLPQQISLPTTCVELQSPQSLWLSMRSIPRVSLTLLGKGRGQNGDLLLLQLSDFILQLDNSLPNCPNLGRMTERVEGDMGVLQPPRESRPRPQPLTFWKNSSSGLPSRAVPGCTTSATRSLSSSSELSSPCQGRGHWHHFLAIALAQQDSQTSGSFLPSPQPPLPAPKTRSPAFQPDPTPSARPQPCCADFSPASARGSCPAWRLELPLPGAGARRASRF